ncbi:MAG: hypothetical protein KIT35_18885 [Piscinibacter sp.]|uniref:hydrogenase expression/formation C-terminal domain-containing protein n=1 Tax=Piscinibacter TaxID=1114981 RepID=UPI000FDEB297|nr:MULTISPECIES: hydrogenase expression/formation C-terminal domain-containing protein [Piscinibacter]MCW5665900.1 hypothetical protein [Piscinibacter sp.]
MEPLKPAPPSGPAALAVLREVARLLDGLAADPASDHTIDLRSLPLADADRAALHAWLGQGEVDAMLQAAGTTRVQETAYAGVWWVRHGDEHAPDALEQIVVARVPALLPAHPQDIVASARRLADDVAAPTPTEENCDG